VLPQVPLMLLLPLYLADCFWSWCVLVVERLLLMTDSRVMLHVTHVPSQAPPLHPYAAAAAAAAAAAVSRCLKQVCCHSCPWTLFLRLALNKAQSGYQMAHALPHLALLLLQTHQDRLLAAATRALLAAPADHASRHGNTLS
jgi:hypothetical protein